MKYKAYILLFIAFVYFSTSLQAQYPQYFKYDDEAGLPSNEVYSITQDSRGFIWMGTDAGLYKFDGVKYIHYEANTQRAKSITGLITSTSNTIYCYNFQSQIFYIEQNVLKELPHPFKQISSIAADVTNNIYVNHSNGIAVYHTLKKNWVNYSAFGKANIEPYTRSARANENNEVYFANALGIGKLKNGKLSTVLANGLNWFTPTEFLLEFHKNDVWIFTLEKNVVYRLSNQKISAVKSKVLLAAIKNRKITGVKALADGCLWLCTYQGVIRYNPENDRVDLFYPQMAFSDAMIDKEGNYWFSTLQSGLISIPNLDFLVWNKENGLIENERLIKIATDRSKIYFSTVNGYIGQLNTASQRLQMYNTNNNADIQALNYDVTDNRLYFSINKDLYALKNDKIVAASYLAFPALKAIQRVGNFYLLASSSGTYVQSLNGEKKYQIDKSWSRHIAANASGTSAWLATNNGLLALKYINQKWYAADTYLSGTQILSVHYQENAKTLYALSFNGGIYQLNEDNNLQKVTTLERDAQAYKILFHDEKIYISSNRGLFIYDLITQKWERLNTLSGLASDNVQDLTIVDNTLWLASGKGLQKLPLKNSKNTPLAKLYLKNQTQNLNNIQLKFGETLILHPEAVSYSSHGNFQYLYRLKNISTEWIHLPSTVDQIEIPNIPSGNFEVELTLLDYRGRYAENTIVVKGNVSPPFWKTLWFSALMLTLFLGLVFATYQYQIKLQRKKTSQQIELNASKLTAIQSQMNPHFIFNSLNSIQDLVLKGDVENSYSYITTFSNLVRKTLSYSEKDYIYFEQELALIDIYLSLEKLRFKNTLAYEINGLTSGEFMVPPLLIQPFIENALIHGLLHKPGKKKLTINFELGESLICTIEDNGIGREEAKRIRNRQNTEHQSFSNKAILKRFDILNTLLKGKFGYHYEDLYCKQVAIGTRVTLIIPVKWKF